MIARAPLISYRQVREPLAMILQTIDMTNARCSGINVESPAWSQCEL